VRSRRFDPASLIAGLAVSGLGVLLLLDQVDELELSFGYLGPLLLGVLGVVLVAYGMVSRR
jgi:hypothetical protein